MVQSLSMTGLFCVSFTVVAQGFIELKAVVVTLFFQTWSSVINKYHKTRQQSFHSKSVVVNKHMLVVVELSKSFFFKGLNSSIVLT